MLLLFLPENKGGEDYTWILSLFMVRSNPLQSLVWLSSGKSLRLGTAGMQTPGCGLARSTGQGDLPGTRRLCLWPPPGSMAQAGCAFCQRFLSFLHPGQQGKPLRPLCTEGETEARGDSTHTSRAAGGEEVCAGGGEDTG